METNERYYKHPVSGEECGMKQDGPLWIVVDSIGCDQGEWFSVGYAEIDFSKRCKIIDKRALTEPTVTLTQTQVVALWKHWPKCRVLQTQRLNAVRMVEAKQFLGLLGAPEDWAAVLVESVVK